MTNDLEVSPNLSDNDVNENLSDISLSSEGSEVNPSKEQEEIKNDDLPVELDEVLHIDEGDELTQFINKARREGFNCLDLSKKNIIEFPKTLLEFPSLQYLYLESNQIAQLPSDLFLCLPYLKWIDLRNNQLTQIPTNGLDKHSSLRYLLLSGNLIRKLPAQLGKVKGLSALNLDGNPLDHPPLEVVKQGIKAIQQYLRDGTNLSENEDEQEQDDFIADVWASSDEDNKEQQQQQQQQQQRQKSRKLKKIVSISNDPVGDAFAARAQEEQRLISLKHQNIKINEELQKVKDQGLLHNWKEDYRASQQQLRRKRLVKGKDYPEAVVQAPFGIDPHYIPVMTKDQQEMVEKAIRYESRRNRSPESVMREEEERRIRDRQIQDRIREITTKMLQRRNGIRGNATEEKYQAELEIRELKKLESEVKQRRTQIDKRFKAYTGNVKARKKL